MNRRDFLCKSACVVAGSLLGVNSFSKAFAFAAQETDPFPGPGAVLRPRIALIIDDIGYSVRRARQFLRLNIPITYSILPRVPYSRDLAIEIGDRGHEVMLHQPMQPYNSSLDPGPGALYEGDAPSKISGIIEENISEVPLAIGVNNHMGSRFTECQREIYETLKVIKNKDLFFIDSRTSNHSKAFKTARRLRLTADRRNVFLDTVRSESAIIFCLHQLSACSQRYGHAIGIGHPFPETARAIEYFLKDLPGSGISLVHISEVMHA
jgi:polysaccharide deacetylase 2 family uncharacterized protein YibQ